MQTRPHILVNVAMTADGKIDAAARNGATISSSADKLRVDRLRAASDAVMVGGRTLIKEDPKLTVKSGKLRQERVTRGLEENPAKVGIVSVADLKLNGNFLTAGPARRLIYTTKRTLPEQVTQLEEAGAEVFVLSDEVVSLQQVMKYLYQKGIRKLLVEGGGTVIAELFRLGLVDELTVYIAPRIFGGASAPTLADGPGFLPGHAPGLRLESVEKYDDDGGVLLHYIVELLEKN
jgi:2,5-diamino-6-(ribosylamino)-4(3H)-pyrimidinone 5'-phosphate reductase